MRLSSVVDHAMHLSDTCFALARDPRHGGRRLAVLATYLRLRTRRFLKRRVAPGTTERIVGYRVGFFNYHTLDYLFNEVFVGLEYHFETPSRRPFIVDCGGNIGMSVLFFKRLHPDAEILVFEPGPDAHAMLAENVARNGLSDVTVHQKAVGDMEGTISFFVDPADPGSLLASSIQQRMPGVATEVPAVRLSTFVDRPVDFLKLDVEGAELDVLRDMQRRGKLRLVEQMVIEYHHHIAGDDDQLSTLLRILEDEGFGYQVMPGDRRPPERGRFQDVILYGYRKQHASHDSATRVDGATERLKDTLLVASEA